MNKIVLVFNILVTFLFSFSIKLEDKKVNKIELLAEESKNCNVYDSVVNITTANNLISASGVIVYSDNTYTYIATSLFNYHKEYNYEIVFSDYSRYSASLVGMAKEDSVVLFRVNTPNKCVVRYSKSELIDKLERVNLIGMYEYNLVQAESYINDVGVCKNCKEETYKKYYHSLLSVEISDYLIGAGVFDQRNQLLGIVTGRLDNYNMGISMLDVNKLYVICYHLINEGEYSKNYIKYNLLDVNSLTKHEKYLYSLDEELVNGVLVSSIHYLNYLVGGLNLGMVILKVNGVNVSNCYQLDNELSKYKKGSKVELTVKKISGNHKVYRVKL